MTKESEHKIKNSVNSSPNKLKSMSDEELALMAQKGDEAALSEIMERYKPLTLSLAKRYFIRGQEREDVIQEAMIGLFKAVQSYSTTKDTSFAAFVKIICENTLADAVRKSEKNNNKILHDAVPLDDFKFFLEDDTKQYQDNKLSAEELATLWQDKDFQALFSELEWNILNLRVRKFSYQEIAAKLNVSTKSVDNALQRIRKKLKKYLEN